MSMKKVLFGSFLVLVVVVAMPFVSVLSAAEEWVPEKPIHLICTTDPGSTYDIQARVVAAEMSKALNATVIVDNVPGAGHQTGTIRAYRSQPDGYTILYTSTSNLVNNELVAGAPWKTFDFKFLATCYDAMKGGSGVLATASLGDWDDIVNSGKTLRWGTGGAGSTPHIQAITYSHALGLDSAYVTGYSGPDMQAAAARGEVDLIAVPLRYAEQWKDQLNVVLIDSIGPFEKEFGDVPSLEGLGHPEACTKGLVHVIVAPPNTPDNITSVLADAAFKAVSSDAMKELHIKSIASGSAYSPGDADAAMKSMQEYRNLIESSLPFILEAVKASQK